jgi:phage tail sheath gpL-like
MAISFNNIPTTTRTPGAYAEIDNSRALQGLVPNPHKAIIFGQKNTAGTKDIETLQAMTNDGLADGYFGTGSLLARMVNKFKENNPNTELFAMALSGGTTQASARINFSTALSHAAGGAASAGNQTVFMLINGKRAERVVTSGWSAIDIASDFRTYISEAGDFPVTVSTIAASGVLVLSALNSGTHGNYLDVRFNYYDGQSYPTFFGDSAVVSGFEGGAGAPDLGDAWAVIENDQYHYMINPYTDAANLTELENELDDRFKPLEDKQGHAFTGLRGTQASCTTLGNSRNNAHNTIIGANDSPTDPAEWAAAMGAIAAFNLNQDPARPLTGLKLKGVLAPPSENRFTRAEREILLYDGIATYTTDVSGNVLIERSITTYQTNAQGITDPSYLDVQTLATLGEIRYQFKTRMSNRFIVPRFKLADDTFPVQPGTKIAQPKTVRQEIIALFTTMRDIGYIENLQEFIDNLIVQRNETDRNRVDVLLPPDLINQFRVLAGLIQFIL